MEDNKEQPLFDEELPLEVIQAAENLGLTRDDLGDENTKSKLLTIYEHFKKQEPPNFSTFVRELNSQIGLIQGVEPLDKLFLHVWHINQQENAT